ncbi:uncharacterized protein LOC131322745 isoform X7 [Rhododendron vialii]|uniref:uncharacterized protein LOC131322745 isoform X7 n=1 Tax=Rhododendron vialii TaxID=182163 RepID=UPI00265E762E|nr:uncharacterized protein LOC131322745 isoform X7 [Rhododendron vialii]
MWFGPQHSLLSHANEPLVFEVQLLKVVWRMSYVHKVRLPPKLKLLKEFTSTLDALDMSAQLLTSHRYQFRASAGVFTSAGPSQDIFSCSCGGSGDNLRAAIFLWDWRTKKQIACLEESHTVDVTQVHFVPDHQNKLLLMLMI